MLALALLLQLLAAAEQVQADAALPLWPLPWKYSASSEVVALGSQFSFTVQNSNPIIRSAVDRYLKLISVPSSADGTLNYCNIAISKASMTDGVIGADESYDLNVDSSKCSITAATTWGALRALETFSQLLSRTENSVQLTTAPVSISDLPRYGHRGLLIDTARHFQPVSEIKRVIDSLVVSKFNVLHWHVIDAESFPVNTPSEPTMVQGAFSPSMTYSLQDIDDVYLYGLYRGVEVIVEVDVPGHAAAWTKGKKEIMADCFVKYYYNINDFALNPALDLTYITVANVLGDITKSARSSYLHLGGDEVVYGCWKNDTSITAFMQSNNITSYDALLAYFVQRVDSNVLGGDDVSGRNVQTVIHWEEVFTAQVPLSAQNTIYQVWTDSSKVADITSAKFRVIASPSNYWYLNIASNTWSSMYAYDPTMGLTADQKTYIIGGETALWGEYIDESNIESNLYPRACAVAERLWSDASMTSDSSAALPRLTAQKCRMQNRGFKPSPIQPADYCSTLYV